MINQWKLTDLTVKNIVFTDESVKKANHWFNKWKWSFQSESDWMNLRSGSSEPNFQSKSIRMSPRSEWLRWIRIKILFSICYLFQLEFKLSFVLFFLVSKKTLFSLRLSQWVMNHFAIPETYTFWNLNVFRSFYNSYKFKVHISHSKYPFQH